MHLLTEAWKFLLLVWPHTKWRINFAAIREIILSTYSERLLLDIHALSSHYRKKLSRSFLDKRPRLLKINLAMISLLLSPIHDTNSLLGVEALRLPMPGTLVVVLFLVIYFPTNVICAPPNLYYKSHLCRQSQCWSFRFSWSNARRHCCNYIFILDLTPGFNGEYRDNFKARRETFKFGDFVRFISEIWWYIFQ